MKNILITQDCFIKGDPVSAGEIVKNVDNSTAAQLLTSGRAVLDSPKAKAVEAPTPPTKKATKKKAAKKDEG